MGACGGASQHPGSAHGTSSTASLAGASARERDGDGDNDALGVGSPHDPDNDAAPTYGSAADEVDARAIARLLRLYYAAAGAGDGRVACSLLQPTAVEALVEQHGPGKGPRALRGSGCAQIASKLLRRHRRELTEGAAALTVPIVQMRGDRAWAVVDLGGAREYVALLHRADAGWKFVELPGYTQPL
jgi:hypothetical protein